MPRTSESTENSSIEFERRRYSRSKLTEIVYITLGVGNGGIVLDVSERGLSFHAAAVLENNNAVSVKFATQRLSSFEVLGNIAWKDMTGKSGGLYFPRLPEQLHEELMRWQGHVPAPAKRADSDRTDNASATDKRRFYRLAFLVALGISLLLGFNSLWAFRIYKGIRNNSIISSADALRTSRAVTQSSLTLDRQTLKHKAELLATLASVTPDRDISFDNALRNPLITEGADLVALGDAGGVTAFYAVDRQMRDVALQELMTNRPVSTDAPSWWVGNGNLYEFVFQPVDLAVDASKQSRTLAVGRLFGYKELHNLSSLTAAEIALLHNRDVIESTLRPLEEVALQDAVRGSCCESEMNLDGRVLAVTSLSLGQSLDDVRLLIFRSAKVVPVEQRQFHELFLIDLGITIISVVACMLLWLKLFSARDIGPDLGDAQADLCPGKS